MLNSAEHEIFSANKYENANNNWHFHIYKQRNINAQLLNKKKIAIVCNLRFINMKFSLLINIKMPTIHIY